MFIGCDGAILVEAQVAAFPQQTTPFALAGTGKMVGDQLHGSLWLAQNSGANPPLFFRATNPAATFHTAILPRPAFPAIPAGATVSHSAGWAGAKVMAGATAPGAVQATMTTNATASTDGTLTVGTGFVTYTIPNVRTVAGTAILHYCPVGAVIDTPFTMTAAAGGALTAGTTYYYRQRYRFTHGSGWATAPFSIALGANTQVQFTTMANEAGARGDYIGWTLERTKVGGTTAGPFYLVDDATFSTQATYNDVKADADLGYRVDDNVHGEAPHFEGLLAFKDRLVGWEGSNVWYSQAVADIEATGIANYNALSASAIGPDDGDPIQCVVRQVDRLIVLKRWSVWGVEGDDITSFRAFPLYHGAGASGSRAAAAVGADVYFYGEAGLHRISGNSVEPFGWVEVGHLLETFKSGQAADVVVKNYLGQHVLVSFSSSAAYDDDMLVYDLRFRGWTRNTGWYAQDILVQKAGSFGNSRAVVMVDRKDRDAGAGFDYPVWLGFYGFKDEKASNGTGGSAPVVVLETPWIDDGTPNLDKDWESLQCFLSGTGVTASFEVTADPDRRGSVSVDATQSGAVWGGANWGAFNWATVADSAPIHGIPAGVVGRRYKVRFVCLPTASMTFKGYVLDGIVQPKSDYSRA